MDKPLKKPSMKQKKALALMIENGGNASKAMREAGYSDAMANNPQRMTQSQGFQQLMHEMGVTDDKLVKVINEGLDAAKFNEFTGEVTPDHQNRHKYLETALRLKGHGKVENPTSVSFIQVVNEQKSKYDL